MCLDALWNLSIKKEITCKWQNYSFFSNKCAPLSVTSNAKYNESELCKTVRLTSFQNPQLQSFWIFFNFIHPYLLFHLHDYLYLLLLFWAVIFLFHSILGWFNNRKGTSVDKGALIKQLAWPITERQIGHRKSCLVLSARFPVVNWRCRPVT